MSAKDWMWIIEDQEPDGTWMQSGFYAEDEYKEAVKRLLRDSKSCSGHPIRLAYQPQVEQQH